MGHIAFCDGLCHTSSAENLRAACVQAIFNDVKGDECVFLWRAIGAALVSVVSVTSYSLKARPTEQAYYLIEESACIPLRRLLLWGCENDNHIAHNAH